MTIISRIPRQAAVLLVKILLPLAPLWAWAEPPAAMIVSPAEQANRDARRVEILQSEIDAEQAASIESVKRRAERLAANDSAGVQEAEAAIAQHTRNLETLRREIEIAAKSPAVAPAAVDRAAAKESKPVSWWDVYAHDPRKKTRPGNQ